MRNHKEKHSPKQNVLLVPTVKCYKEANCKKKALHQYLFHVCVILEEVKSLLGQDMLLQKTLNLCYSWISNV